MVKLEIIKNLIIAGFIIYFMVTMGKWFGVSIQIFDMKYVATLLGITLFAAYLAYYT